MAKKHPVLLTIIALLIAFGVFYAWGAVYYQKDAQVNRIIAALDNPKKDLSSYVEPSNPDIAVSEEKLKPLQSYFKENKAAKKQLIKDIKSGKKSDQIELTEEGTYFLLFPKYVLRVRVYRPQIETNHAHSKLSVNGKNYGEMSGGDQNYYQDLGLVFPGRYHVVVKTTVSGRKLTANAVTNIWSNKVVNLKIKTGTFQIRSVPNGVVYINDKKVKTLDKSGQAIFKNYPLAKDTELYVETTVNGKKIKSEKVKDLSTSIDSEFSNSDDNTSDYGNQPYAGNAANDVYQDVEGDYIVNPIWPGLITKKMAGHLLYSNYLKADATDFEQGKEDSNYKKLVKQLKKFRKGKKKLKLSVEITEIIPIGNYSSQVEYKLTYKYKFKKKTKKKTFTYTGAIFHQVQGKQLIQNLGKEK